MEKVDFFKLQAKNLMRDFSTGILDEEGIIRYSPRYFPNIDWLFITYNINEEKFTLMKAQHLIAGMAGFRKWNDLARASEARLKLGKLLFEKSLENPSIVDDWELYKENLGIESLTDDSYLELFKQIFL